MKIAVFIKSTTYHKGHGGFETQNKNLCEGLVQRGHRIIVYSPRKELGIETAEENGVLYKFIACRFSSFRVLYSKSKDSWENRVLEIFSKDNESDKYDLVLGQSSWALPIIRNKTKFGIKIISILHGSKIGEYQTELKNAKSAGELVKCVRDIPHVLRAFFGTQREFVHGSDKLVAVSNFVKKSIIDETYVLDDKVTVIHNGVDEKKFESGAGKDIATQEPVKIIYIGRVIRAKGLFILIDVVKKLLDLKISNWKLEIIGEGEALAELQEIVKKKDLTDKVVFSGHIKYEDIVTRLSSSDIFVLPSLRMEGFPMTIVEAMFAGLPVIASDIGGNSDAVINDQTGYLVKPSDTDALAESLKKLIESPEKRVTLGKNSRNKALKEFTISCMLDKYEQVFKEVLK